MIKKILVLAGLLCVSAVSFAQEKVEFALFVSPTCVHCNKLKQEYWGPLQEKFKDTVHFTEYDISTPQGSLAFQKTAEAYGVPKNKMGYPAAAIGSTYLMGYPQEIGMYAENAIEKARLLHEKTNVVTVAQENVREQAKSTFAKFTVWAIIGNGLIDGINPCAFAVIVFFISFLTVYKYNRREIVLVGVSYCVAVFLAYLLLGLGVFKFLYAMRGFTYVIKGFYIVTAAVCLLFFVLSAYDFWIYKKTKKSNGMLLQLSLNNKTRIHKIMGFFLRDKQKSSLRLVLAALTVGFGVSLVEAVCTGQVYVPTCVLIMQEPCLRAKAVFYLVLYNIMFIVPLVTVFVLALLGYESKGFNDFFKKHLGFTKILLCLVFLALFVLLLQNI